MVTPDQYTGPSEFVHLHNHTILSVLDGVARPDDYAEACGTRGYPAIAITEHGHMASVPDMYFACKKHGVKYIPACEIYYNDYELERQRSVAAGTKLKVLRGQDELLAQRYAKNRHLTVLAKNETGFHNLIKLTTLAHQFGFYYKPRIWFEKLCEYKEGLIVLSGCFNGPVSHELYLDIKGIKEDGKRIIRRPGVDKKASEYIQQFRKIFGEDYFIEVQMPCLPELYDNIVFTKLLELAERFGIKAVLTNDCHYLTRDDFLLQRVMMAVEQKTNIYDPNMFQVNSDHQYFKTRAELWATFKNNDYSKSISDAKFEEICNNTLLVAERCNPLNPDTAPKIPDWGSVEPGVDAATELRRITHEALAATGLDKVTRRWPVDGREVTYAEQAEIELDRFISKGFASYFLITRDLLTYGKSRGWPFGPRGCVIPGSLVTMEGGAQQRIEDVQIGEIIQDGFGDSQVVENKFIYDVSEELYVFELHGITLTVTADHKLYVIRDGFVQLLKAAEIKDTDEIIGDIKDRPANHEDSES